MQTARQKFKIGDRVKHKAAFKGTVKGYIKGQRYRVRVLVDGDAKTTLWNAAYWEKAPILSLKDCMDKADKADIDAGYITDADMKLATHEADVLSALEIDWNAKTKSRIDQDTFTTQLDASSDPLGYGRATVSRKPSLWRALKKWILGR